MDAAAATATEGPTSGIKRILKPQMNADERRFDFLPHEVEEDKGGGLNANAKRPYAEPTGNAPSLALPHFVEEGISGGSATSREIAPGCDVSGTDGRR
jgi:hypothetical protein